MAIYCNHNFPFAVLPLVFNDYKVSILHPSIDNCHAKLRAKEIMKTKV